MFIFNWFLPNSMLKLPRTTQTKINQNFPQLNKHNLNLRLQSETEIIYIKSGNKKKRNNSYSESRTHCHMRRSVS